MEIELQEGMMADWKVVKGARLWVNGIGITNVSRFNMAEGWAEAFVNSPSGWSNLDMSPDDFVVSRIYGHVEVEYR